MLQILGLLDALAGIYARLEAIEDLLPTPNFFGDRENKEPQAIEIPDYIDVFPSARLHPDLKEKERYEGKTDKLPRPAFMSVAIAGTLRYRIAR